MGTLTDAVISTTYKKLVFQKSDNKFYYTNGSDVDTELTTFASAMTFSGLGTFTSGIKIGAGGLIKDSGGNEAIHITTTGSAVNYLKVIPSATSNAVSLDVDGDDSNIGLTLDGKGTGVVTSTPLLVATAGVKLGNNELYASDGGTAITLDTSDNVTITGDLTVTGNDIKSSAATAITLSSDDVTIVGDLTVTGTSSGTMTLGADSDDVDRSLIFGHATLKSIIGIDDSQDVFAINTDGAFEANNDVEIDASGNVTINNGSIQCTTIDYTDGDLALTVANGGGVTCAQSLTVTDNIVVSGTDAVANTFANATTFNGAVTATGKLLHLFTATEAKTADFTAAVNKIYLITKVDGCDVTLPAPTAGARIRLVFGAVTSNNHTVTTDGSGTLYNGYLLMSDVENATSGEFEVHAPDGSDDRIITMNGTTTGIAGVVDLIGTATNRWYVEGDLHASGTVATPFS